MNILEAINGYHISKKIKNSNYYEHFYNDSLNIILEEKILYAECSKVACTTIKKLLYEYISNHEHIIDDIAIHRKRITGFKGAIDFGYTDLYKLFKSNDFYKFCFVRNPYDRVLSAYHDKIVNFTQTKEYIRTYSNIQQWTKKNKKSDTSDDVNFEKFIHFICSQDYFLMDRHWFPQYQSMWFPYINYDYIGRFESFEQDISVVLTHLNAPNHLFELSKVKQNQSNIKKSGGFNKDTANIFYQKFKMDFKAFGYCKNSWVEYQ